MSKIRLLFLASIWVIVAGCNRAPTDDSPSVTTSPSESAKPIEFQTAPIEIRADAVAKQDVAVLAAAAWTTKQCALVIKDATDSEVELVAASSGFTEMAGFFIDPEDHPAGEFQIVLKGNNSNYAIPARTGWDRTDVADYFKMPQLASSGYHVLADLAQLPSGSYEVDFMVARDGVNYFCESGKRLIKR